MPANQLSIRQKKDVFESLVKLQDTHRVSVPESKKQVMDKYDLTPEQFESIIEEGIEGEWLDEMLAKAG